MTHERSAQSLRKEIHSETGRNGKGMDFNRLAQLLDELETAVLREPLVECPAGRLRSAR